MVITVFYRLLVRVHVALARPVYWLPIMALLILSMPAFAQSRIPTDAGRDSQLERLNRFNIEQRQNLERDRAVREQRRRAQQRVLELNNQRREELRQRLDDAQESIRDRQNYQLRSLRTRQDAARDRQRLNRLEQSRDVRRDRTSGAAAAQRNLRNIQTTTRERRIENLQNRRQATSNRFLSERYFRSREQRGR